MKWSAEIPWFQCQDIFQIIEVNQRYHWDFRKLWRWEILHTSGRFSQKHLQDHFCTHLSSWVQQKPFSVGRITSFEVSLGTLTIWNNGESSSGDFSQVCRICAPSEADFQYWKISKNWAVVTLKPIDHLIYFWLWIISLLWIFWDNLLESMTQLCGSIFIPRGLRDALGHGLQLQYVFVDLPVSNLLSHGSGVVLGIPFRTQYKPTFCHSVMWAFETFCPLHCPICVPPAYLDYYNTTSGSLFYVFHWDLLSTIVWPCYTLTSNCYHATMWPYT